MKKKLLSIIALMLVTILALTSCSYVNKAIDFIKELFSPSVDLTDEGLKTEKIIDFKNGANADVFFESDGWSNGDVFNVVWKKHNVHYENGIMRLGITKEKATAWIDGADVEYSYTAGEARSQNYYHYGDYEVSMKPSANPGTASTFFICTGPYDTKDGVPNPHDEIDIEFLGQDTTHVQFNFFVDGKGGNEYMYDLGFDASKEFHTYGFRWTKTSITWFVDGEPVYKVTTDTSVKEAGNVRIVEKLPSTAGRILSNYWCGNERAWAWMGKYTGETKDNGTQYQWIATSAEGAPLNPPAVNPPEGGETAEIDWAKIDPIVPNFPSVTPYDVVVEGTKARVTYTDVSGSAYMPIELDVTDAVAGKNYVHLTVTNNGTETVNVRVNMFDPTLTGNNKATNISATMNGVAVRTDLEWGGSFFDIPAGETAELVVNFGVGGVKLQLMIDSSRNDGNLRSGDVTIEDVKFAAVGEVVAPHKCEDANDDGKCDGCGEDMPAPPAPPVEDPVSGDLTAVIEGKEVTIGGNTGDGYGVNVNDDDSTIKVEYTNIVGNSYKNIWFDASSIAGTKNTYTMKVTNTGAESVKVRVDIESRTQTSPNTTCCNVSATQDGVEVYTDKEWGGSTFVIEAGATATLVVVYDASKLPTNVKIMVDSCQWDDDTAHAGAIIISEIAFGGEYTPVEPDPNHVCESVCPECGLCLDAACLESACASKCQGHGVTPPAEDTGLQLDFYPEANTGYEVNGLNIKYNGKGGTYKPVTAPEIGALTLGKNTLTLTITNNGAADSRVRVDVQGTTWVSTGAESGTDACNISAVGGDSWTDTTWGGTAVTVPAGQSVTITITYTNYGPQGLVKNILVFVDSARGGDEIYNSDITLSGITFGGEESAPVVEHACESICSECGLCLDAECLEDACAEKCQGHTVTPPVVEHACESICPECGLCLDAECLEDACADKCQGHTVTPPVVEHACESVCPECGLCLDAECLEDACAEKCQGHAPVDLTPEAGEYLKYDGNDCYTFDKENYLEEITFTYENVSTNTYQNVNAWIKDKAAGKTTLDLYLVNNGTETVYVTVKLEAAGAVALAEEKVYVAAGEVKAVTLNFTGEAEFLYFFIDTGWSETTTSHSGSVTVAGVRFSGEAGSVTPPADTGLQLNFWTSASSYTTSGNNIKYSGAGNTYACAGSDVSAHAAGKTTFTVTITNNGTETSRVRIDVQGTTKVGNHDALNTSATGGDVWTNMEWGGSTVTVAAGESVTLVITYDEHTERGAVTNVIVFVDSARGDSNTYNSDITLSGMSFS